MSTVFKLVKNNAKTYTAFNALNSTTQSLTFLVEDGTRLAQPTAGQTFYLTAWRQNLYSDPGDDPRMRIGVVTAVGANNNPNNVTVTWNGTLLALPGRVRVAMLIIDAHFNDITTALNAAENLLASHISNTSNPHNVTKSQIGLGNVDNTSDANKPISTATQTALNGKEPVITAGTITQYWRGDKTWQTLDKTAVGLSNVDNTSDLNKPISTATQTALNAKANTSSLAAVALSGSYNDLINKPTIPAAQVNSDWNATSGVAQILNKPTIPVVSGTNTGDQTLSVAGSNITISGPNGNTVTVPVGSAADATTTSKGSVQLAGDLGGAGTTAAAPFVKGRMRVFDVNDYLMVADGVTDNKTAYANIVAAVDAAGGGIIQYGIGNYYSSLPLTPHSNTIVRGMGMDVTFLSQSAASTGGNGDVIRTVASAAPYYNNVLVEDLTVDASAPYPNGQLGSYPGSYSNGITMQGVHNARTKNVKVIKPWGYGVQITSPAGKAPYVYRPVVENLHVLGERCGQDSLGGGGLIEPIVDGLYVYPAADGTNPYGTATNWTNFRDATIKNVKAYTTFVYGLTARSTPDVPPIATELVNPFAFPVTVVLGTTGSTITDVKINNVSQGTGGTYTLPGFGTIYLNWTGSQPTWTWTAPQAPSLATSGTAMNNPFPFPIPVTISGGNVSAVAINGTTQSSTSGYFLVPLSGTITITYSTAPTVSWATYSPEQSAGIQTDFGAVNVTYENIDINGFYNGVLLDKPVNQPFPSNITVRDLRVFNIGYSGLRTAVFANNGITGLIVEDANMNAYGMLGAASGINLTGTQRFSLKDNKFGKGGVTSPAILLQSDGTNPCNFGVVTGNDVSVDQSYGIVATAVGANVFIGNNPGAGDSYARSVTKTVSNVGGDYNVGSAVDAQSIITSAISSLTSGRTWPETVVIRGNFLIASPIIIPSYTNVILDGAMTTTTLRPSGATGWADHRGVFEFGDPTISGQVIRYSSVEFKAGSIVNGDYFNTNATSFPQDKTVPGSITDSTISNQVSVNVVHSYAVMIGCDMIGVNANNVSDAIHLEGLGGVNGTPSKGNRILNTRASYVIVGVEVYTNGWEAGQMSIQNTYVENAVDDMVAVVANWGGKTGATSLVRGVIVDGIYGRKNGTRGAAIKLDGGNTASNSGYGQLVDITVNNVDVTTNTNTTLSGVVPSEAVINITNGESTLSRNIQFTNINGSGNWRFGIRGQTSGVDVHFDNLHLEQYQSVLTSAVLPFASQKMSFNNVTLMERNTTNGETGSVGLGFNGGASNQGYQNITLRNVRAQYFATPLSDNLTISGLGTAATISNVDYEIDIMDSALGALVTTATNRRVAVKKYGQIIQQDNGGVTLQNLAPAVYSTDAVNLSQLTTTASGKVDNLPDVTLNSPATLAAGMTSQIMTVGTYPAPTPTATLGTPGQRYALTNRTTSTITHSFPNPAGTTINLTVLVGETITFRQVTTSGYINESGNKPLAQLDARYTTTNAVLPLIIALG